MQIGPHQRCEGNLLLGKTWCRPTGHSVLQTVIIHVKVFLSTHNRSQQERLLGGSLELR